MPFSGTGTYAAPASSWNPAVDATDVNSTDWAALLADITTALSLCILKDGQQTTTGTIPFATAVTMASTLVVTGQVTQSAAQKHKAAVDMVNSTYSVAAADYYLLANRAGTTTVTLGTATAGRMLYFGTLQAQAVISASSNVIPLGDTVAGTAILAATDGKFALLQGDGTNWRILMAN